MNLPHSSPKHPPNFYWLLMFPRYGRARVPAPAPLLPRLNLRWAQSCLHTRTHAHTHRFGTLVMTPSWINVQICKVGSGCCPGHLTGSDREGTWENRERIEWEKGGESGMHVWKGRKRPYQRCPFRCTNLGRQLLCFQCVSNACTDAVAMIHIAWSCKKMYRMCTTHTHTDTKCTSGLGCT